MKKQVEPIEVVPAEENKLAPITAIEVDIARMKEQYKDLSIAGPDDKEGFNKVASARKDVKKAMASVEKIRKSLVDDAVKWQRQVNSAARAINDQLEEVKRPLELKETQFILAAEELKRQEEQARQLKIQSRAESILKLNARFNGTHFTLGQVSISQSAIERLEDEDFESELNLIRQESETIIAQEEAHKKEQEDERRRLKEESDRLKAAQAQLEKDRAELDALRASVTPVVAPVDSVEILAESTGSPIKIEGNVFDQEKSKPSFEEMIAAPEIGRSGRAIPPPPAKKEDINLLVKAEAAERYGEGSPEYTAFRAGAKYVLDKNNNA